MKSNLLFLILWASVAWGQGKTHHCTSQPAGDGCNTETVCDDGYSVVTAMACFNTHFMSEYDVEHGLFWADAELPILTRPIAALPLVAEPPKFYEYPSGSFVPIPTCYAEGCGVPVVTLPYIVREPSLLAGTPCIINGEWHECGGTSPIELIEIPASSHLSSVWTRCSGQDIWYYPQLYSCPSDNHIWILEQATDGSQWCRRVK